MVILKYYEIMIILRPDLSDEQIDQFVERIVGEIESEKGEVIWKEKWGKRQLTYEIKKLTEGYYLLFQAQVENAVIRETDRKMKIDDNVLKFLIVSIDEKRLKGKKRKAEESVAVENGE